MKLLSSGVCKKPSLDVPEDLVGGSNNFYWLLDGAGKGNHKLTVEYVSTLDHYFKEFAKTANDPEDLLFNAIKSTKIVFEKRGVIVNPPSSTVIIVQILRDCLRYLVLGDSYLCVCAGEKVVTITDKRLASVAVQERNEVRTLREQGVPENSAKYIEARRRLICAEESSRNKDGGYWIAELNPDAAKEALVGTLPLPNLVFAVTDGLERLVSVFDIYSGLKALGETILEKGDSYVFNQLRLLEEEPENFKRPISSKHDDASYFLIFR